MNRRLVKAGIVLLTVVTLLLNPFKSQQALSEPPQHQIRSVIIRHIRTDKEKILKLISQGTGIARIDCDFDTKLPAAIDLGFREPGPDPNAKDLPSSRKYLPSFDIRSAKIEYLGTALELRGRSQSLWGGIDVKPMKVTIHAVEYGDDCKEKGVVNGIINPDRMEKAVKELKEAKEKLIQKGGEITLRDPSSGAQKTYKNELRPASKFPTTAKEKCKTKVMRDLSKNEKYSKEIRQMYEKYATDGSPPQQLREKIDQERNKIKDKYASKECDGEPEYKAVFIRPCEGQLFTSFDGGKTIGPGSIDRVCKDLHDSWVTDVFVAFKVDHEGKGCGDYGELLYPSQKYHANVSSKFSGGADPIRTLMEACYGLRFHAWFPVFLDPNAIQYAEKKGGKARQAAKFLGFLDYLSPVYSKDFADPNNRYVVEYELGLLKEITEMYPDLFGINLDYIRYADLNDFRVQYEKETGKKFPENYFVAVNPQAVTEFVKTVLGHFPFLKRSADVRAGKGPREGVGQDGILPYLDWIMPMSYVNFAGFEGDKEVKKWALILKGQYPNKTLIPILRGWVCRGKAEGCSVFE
ncbi:hypothetical protein HYT84_02615, partial [Candidatus Micrarchaeota archaeon]|nr:hypothetical protein [Candidatus Micrarchaeota archaeon]